MSLKRLFVGNLSNFTSEDELREAFARHGAVSSVNLVFDQAGKHRGFGFVEYETAEAAEGGLLALNGSMLHGRMLFVNVARASAISDTADRELP
jgi:RNA recognition motif-containing protein